ncbi:hypothetical protein KFE25_000952 [Diacronema lutheri]|uniref:NAD(P)-binding domain-containing protein n=2 Tax=Diacronema lutheri TaxID=2081491 RepID=A0A8J5X310_DIALT|nr:hypothetical protein KFE25_000952 [Diacronema lutheri]
MALIAIVVAAIGATQPLVAVVGAGGNVGKLVALRLSDSHRVRAVVRDASKVASFLNRPNIEIVEAEVTGASAEPGGSLERALRGAVTVVACTGTTAFPTKAWSTSGDTDVTPAFVSALLGERLDVRAALARLDAQGLNTPNNVDDAGVRAVLRAWAAAADRAARRRFVLMSSIGVTKRGAFPFSVLNACGVLDAKAAGEEAVAREAKADGFAYTIVRPGQLFGGPYDNNYYLGTLFQLDKDAATQDVELAIGDSLTGDTLRSTLAEVIARSVEVGGPSGTDFTVVNRKGTPPSGEQIEARLRALS